MREIKFRAWDKAMSIMTPTFDIFSSKSNPFGDRVIFGDPFYDKENAQMFLLKDLTIMQYTGLKDKNGKEIYEGDILINHNTKTAKVVAWNEKICGFNIRKSTMELSGNIYENKNLLREEV